MTIVMVMIVIDQVFVLRFGLKLGFWFSGYALIYIYIEE